LSTEPKVKHVAIRPVADTWPSRRRGAECPIWSYRPPPGPGPVCRSEARRGVPTVRGRDRWPGAHGGM